MLNGTWPQICQSRNLQNFSPSKISCYTVHYFAGANQDLKVLDYVMYFFLFLGLLKLGFRTTFSLIAEQLNKYIEIINI